MQMSHIGYIYWTKDVKLGDDVEDSCERYVEEHGSRRSLTGLFLALELFHV